MEGHESFLLSAFVVYVLLPYTSVLTTQALYTTILVCIVKLGLAHTREVRRASVVAAFPILNLSVQGEVVSDGGAKICELLNDIELIVISFSFSFSSRWHRSVRKGPYALRPVS